jgi:DnaJ-class molecular chaperone
MAESTRRGHRGSVVILEQALPVVYRSWSEWRAHCRTRRDTARGSAGAAPNVAATEFCATCWGNGRILRHARNGEGLIPTACGACDATGRVAAT